MSKMIFFLFMRNVLVSPTLALTIASLLFEGVRKFFFDILIKALNLCQKLLLAVGFRRSVRLCVFHGINTLFV